MAFDPWIYDTDGDCYISTAEKDQAVADWQAGLITMSDAMAVVNLWVMGTKNPACEEPPPEPTGWQLLESIDITLKPPGEVGGWNLLQSIDIILKPPEAIGGWNLLQSIDITLTPTGYEPPPVTCSVDADCPENEVCTGGKCVCAEGYVRNESGICVKKGAFPWKWVAIAGATIAGVILLIPKPKKAKEKVK